MHQFFTADLDEAAPLMLKKHGKMFEIPGCEVCINKCPGGSEISFSDPELIYIVQWED